MTATDDDDFDWDEDNELSWLGAFRWARNTLLWVMALVLLWLVLGMMTTSGEFEIVWILSAAISSVFALVALALAIPVARLVTRLLRRLHVAFHTVVFTAMGVGVSLALTTLVTGTAVMPLRGGLPFVEIPLVYEGVMPLGLAIIFACASAVGFVHAYSRRFDDAYPGGVTGEWDGPWWFLSGLRTWGWMNR